MIYSARLIQNTYITVFKTPEANGIESEEERRRRSRPLLGAKKKRVGHRRKKSERYFLKEGRKGKEESRDQISSILYILYEPFTSRCHPYNAHGANFLQNMHRSSPTLTSSTTLFSRWPPHFVFKLPRTPDANPITVTPFSKPLATPALWTDH